MTETTDAVGVGADGSDGLCASEELDEKRRRELGRYLRAKRSVLGPAEVGLPPGGVRRTPGLRREEVALLAGVGITWYTWLEQGRPINPSDDVLTSIARTLQLSAAETDHLLALARDPAGAPVAIEVPASLRSLCDSLDPSPAFVMDSCWDIRSWNVAADALFGISSVEPAARNVAWMMFEGPLRSMLDDWDDHARRLVGELRADRAAALGNPRFCEVLARLTARHAEAEQMWEAYEVQARSGAYKRVDHPVVGPLELDRVALESADAPGLQLMVHQPRPGTATAARLQALCDLHSGVTANA